MVCVRHGYYERESNINSTYMSHYAFQCTYIHMCFTDDLPLCTDWWEISPVQKQLFCSFKIIEFGLKLQQCCS